MKSALSNLLKSLGFVPCPGCGGSGSRPIRELAFGVFDHAEAEAARSGADFECPDCDGSGFVRKSSDNDVALLLDLHDDYRPESP